MLRIMQTGKQVFPCSGIFPAVSALQMTTALPNEPLDCIYGTTVVTGMIRAKIIRRPLREAISRGFSALRELRAKGG